MGPELVGYFVKLQLSLNEVQQGLEAHIDDMKSIDFMKIFREFHLTHDCKSNLQIKIQNLRGTLTYCGHLEILRGEDGDCNQLVTLFLNKVIISQII